jgi:MraZ protein
MVDARLATLDPFSKEARELKRFFFSAASDAELDKQGRVLVPPALSRHARLGREVVVAGVHDHLEIWDRNAWSDHVTKVEGSADDVAERLADKR